jgi:hypothetical protein
LASGEIEAQALYLFLSSAQTIDPPRLPTEEEREGRKSGKRLTLGFQTVRSGRTMSTPTGGEDHCLEHGLHELTLGPDELQVVQAFLFDGRSNRVVISSFRGVDKAMMRASPRRAFACFLE